MGPSSTAENRVESPGHWPTSEKLLFAVLQSMQETHSY